jgi:valyl-tRNA synthetase
MPLTDFFEHRLREPEIYRRWEESGAFVADVSSDRPAFTISMPPPNATGTLHLGHAEMLALEDLMIRWRRMAGDEVLWLPGTDHAAIATESVVIRILQKEGMSDPRAELGRERLVARIAEFVERSRATINAQVRAMGSSCDWSRERYTMDVQLNRCVNAVFVSMMNDGLVYRGSRIVNWDPVLRTTVSDDEIYHEEREAEFYTIRYGPFLVGTSRPETKLGDTAVAVHPQDERWSRHIGSEITVQWPKGPTIRVRVVAEEEHVDPSKGTGALGVTPAHSQVDFDIAQKHNLPLVQVIGEDGRMTEAAGAYAGMTVLECRRAFVADLEEAGLLEKVETYRQPISLCYRSKQPIEPLPKAQWFIDVSKPAVVWKGRSLSLKQVMREVVESGEISILPDYEEKKYYHWIDNLRDWCISRQIWWGHRVPVWYHASGELHAGHRTPPGPGWVQDPDTLDTWFSSALWTWSTLVDPEAARDDLASLREILQRSPDYRRFHPTAVMETGYDILFFWVARMILMTTYVTGDVPFRTVYLHGLILDRDGEKMTKSKPDTSIDPLEVIEQHGADALRMAMVLGNAPGHDIKLSQEKIEGARRLVTKLWNAARFVRQFAGDAVSGDEASHPVHRWMLARMDELVLRADARMASFAFGDCAEQLRASFWGEFCDQYLEAVKAEEIRALPETRSVVLHVLLQYLKLLHPYLPFVTEALWEEFGQAGMLIREQWPVSRSRSTAWADEMNGVEGVWRAVTAIRGIRDEQGIPPGAHVNVRLYPYAHHAAFATSATILSRMVRAQAMEIVEGDLPAETADGVVAVDADFRVVVEMSVENRAQERERLAKQLDRVRERLVGVRAKLANEEFLARAPAALVEQTRATADRLQAEAEEIQRRIGFSGPESSAGTGATLESDVAG